MKIAIIILLFSMVSCYSQKKARNQFGRAAATYPELPADYCSRVYPAKDSLIRGRDSIRVDTLWGEGEVIIINDTIKKRDTVFIKTIERLPGQVITRNILRTDTVYQENTAAVDLCSIERRAAIINNERSQKELNRWKRVAKKRFLIILGMGAGITVGLFAIIRRKVIKTTSILK